MKQMLFAAAIVALAAGAVAEEAPDIVLGGFSVGDVKLMCRQRHGWKVDFRREADASGVEYAVVEMTREGDEEFPAPFNLSFNFAKRDTVAAWRPWSESSVFTMYWDPANLPGAGTTDFRKWLPLYACYSPGGRNRTTFAASETAEPLTIRAGIREEDNRLYFAFHFYDVRVAKRRHLVAKLRIDPRDMFWADAVREAADWMTAVSGRRPARVPDAAFAPLYSTWYSFHQDVHQDVIERECALASKMGMGTIIVDDGWQTDDTNRGYAFCGDWRESKNRFPDLKAHVAKVHAMGMKYMLWYSVAWIGDKSAAYERFKGKYLYHNGHLRASVLDPRFPEVREFLASLYERAQREWGLDGFKLDFIDSFAVQGTDPAIAENYAGRDIRTVPDAVNALMGEVVQRLRANDPDVLIEFRQSYIGPAVTQYGNMMRAADCPGDRQVNRARIADLRLTSGRAAVHADMLEWNVATPVEEAAGSVISAIFGTVQYSMMLSDLPPDHLRMIAHWVKFGAEHCDALQRGSFKAYEPEAGYPLLCGESASERIFGVYGADRVVHVADLKKATFVLNGTGIGSLCLELPCEASSEVRDTFGAHVRWENLSAGLNRVSVPLGGFVILNR